MIRVHSLHGCILKLGRTANGTLRQKLATTTMSVIGADFRFEVPGQSSVGLIGGGRDQWLGGHHGECGARAYNGGLGTEPPAGSRDQGVRGAKPPEAESILVIGCPTEPANLAPLVKFSK